MAEGGVGMSPQVFVVDSQANYDSVHGGKKPWWARVGQKFLLLLIGFTMLGLVVEGCLIYNLYKKTEVRLISACHFMCVSVCECLCVGLGLGAQSTWKFLFSRISLFSLRHNQTPHKRRVKHVCMWVIICSLNDRSVSNGLFL